MPRTLVWAVGWALLAGCAGRAASPFGVLDARLDSLTGVGESEIPIARLAATVAPAPSDGFVGADGFDSFCLSSNPSLGSAGGAAVTSPSASGTSRFGQDVLDAWDEEATSDASARRGSRRRAPLPGFWDTLKRDVRKMPTDLWEDTKAVYGSTPNLVILGMTYGGALAVQQTGPDDTVESSFRDHTIFSEEARDIFGAVGNPGTHFALAGAWYLLGQQRQDEKTYEVGRTLFSALIINGLSTMVGQAASWDRAPNGEWGAFPSGHTSSTFAVASVMHDAYGPLVGIPLYGVGVLVAMGRLEDDEHYLSDVIMGGVMGLVIGHTVAGEHEFEMFGGKILPYADPNTQSSGLVWVKHFK